MFETFEVRDFQLSDGRIRGRVGGHGEPLLLLHGHPQSHAMWHRVADELTSRFTVVMLDLRGYGDSFRPPADADHINHSKRAMAQDAVEVMAQLGYPRFQLCAHDRGARVAHRMAMDHPQAVIRLMLLDIAPTLAMYRDTSEVFAKAYWHWFFLIQPAPLPERLINADPEAYLTDLMGGRQGGLSMFAADAWIEYVRCVALPGTATSMCEDYRAASTIDLVHDREDRIADRRLSQPLRVLWGAHGTVARCFDVRALWREVADSVSGEAMDCGHYIAEERPHELLAQMQSFFNTSPTESTP